MTLIFYWESVESNKNYVTWSRFSFLHNCIYRRMPKQNKISIVSKLILFFSLSIFFSTFLLLLTCNFSSHWSWTKEFFCAKKISHCAKNKFWIYSCLNFSALKLLYLGYGNRTDSALVHVYITSNGLKYHLNIECSRCYLLLKSLLLYHTHTEVMKLSRIGEMI